MSSREAFRRARAPLMNAAMSGARRARPAPGRGGERSRAVRGGRQEGRQEGAGGRGPRQGARLGRQGRGAAGGQPRGSKGQGLPGLRKSRNRKPSPLCDSGRLANAACTRSGKRIAGIPGACAARRLFGRGASRSAERPVGGATLPRRFPVGVHGCGFEQGQGGRSWRAGGQGAAPREPRPVRRALR